MNTALLTYRTGNIGDDVQSLALAQGHLLGEPDLWLDRDRLSEYAEAGPIHLVANGFFLCPDRSGRLSFPPPPNIAVTYVALCASNVPDTPESRAHLPASGPIGCRDLHTVAWCERRGLPHYFASYPSCLLERDFDAPGRPAPPYDPDGPVVMVEADDLPFRLTALPPWLTIHREADLRRISLDPAAHYTENWLARRAAWRAMARERLVGRVGIEAAG